MWGAGGERQGWYRVAVRTSTAEWRPPCPRFPSSAFTHPQHVCFLDGVVLGCRSEVHRNLLVDLAHAKKLASVVRVCNVAARDVDDQIVEVLADRDVRVGEPER